MLATGPMIRRAPLLLCCAGFASGCAVQPVAPPPAPVAAAPVRPGVILAIRPQVPNGQNRDVLSALGVDDPQPAPRAVCDVTLRLDDGRLVSVVAPGSAPFKVGNRADVLPTGDLIASGP